MPWGCGLLKQLALQTLRQLQRASVLAFPPVVKVLPRHFGARFAYVAWACMCVGWSSDCSQQSLRLSPR